jgi:hypothetical protein
MTDGGGVVRLRPVHRQHIHKLRVEESTNLQCLAIIVPRMAVVVAAKAGRSYSDHG